MKSKLLIISICAIFILNSCASTKYSSAYDDSIYYYPSEISKTERKADQQTIDKLTAETKNNRNKYKNSDTVFISNRTVAELD